MEVPRTRIRGGKVIDIANLTWNVLQVRRRYLLID